MGKLQDKVALITGSSSGIGRGIAIAFAREGARVIVNYPDEAETQNAAGVRAEIERIGTQALDVRADVSVEHEAQTLVETVQRNFGRIDILVNNAGIGNVARVEAMAPSQWDRMIAVNLRSVFLCTHFVLPIMYRQDHGRITAGSSAPPRNSPTRAARSSRTTARPKPGLSRSPARSRTRSARATSPPIASRRVPRRPGWSRASTGI
jgi:NAD(P)-dependent dehydrogenase (short-subunit alcohol dehydrogenase family)